MSQLPKTSANNGHNYMKGYRWWSENRFWHEPGRMFSQSIKDYYDNWVESLRSNERSMTRLTGGK
jgi:hypothetical protein